MLLSTLCYTTDGSTKEKTIAEALVPLLSVYYTALHFRGLDNHNITQRRKTGLCIKVHGQTGRPRMNGPHYLFCTNKFISFVHQHRANEHSNLVQRSNWECACVALDNTDNNSKDAEGTGKNLHNQNLDKETGILRISDCTGRPCDSDGHARRNICQTNTQTSRKHSISGVVVSRVIPVVVQVIATVLWLFDFVCQNNSHDHAVNRCSLTENYTSVPLRIL